MRVPPSTDTSLSRRHFAFYRGCVEGMPLRRLAQRFLSEEEATRAGAIRRWIAAELAGFFKRRGDDRSASLFERTATRRQSEGAAGTLPDIASFAEEADPDGFFSESELLALYHDRFGKQIPVAASGSRISPRQRSLNARRLAALAAAEQHFVASAISPSDRLAVHLGPTLGGRLEAIGLFRVEELALFIEARGANWFRAIPRIGRVAADRITTWLAANAMSVRTSETAERTAFDLRITTIVKDFTAALQRFEASVPAAFERGKAHATALISGFEWLNGHSRRRNTWRRYKSELLRLHAWSTIERGKAFSALDAADASHYLRFLAAPPSRWISGCQFSTGDRGWRPLRSPLSSESVSHARRICESLFDWLLEDGKATINPFATQARPVTLGGTGPAACVHDRRTMAASTKHVSPGPDRPNAGHTSTAIQSSDPLYGAASVRSAQSCFGLLPRDERANCASGYQGDALSTQKVAALARPGRLPAASAHRELIREDSSFENFDWLDRLHVHLSGSPFVRVRSILLILLQKRFRLSISRIARRDEQFIEDLCSRDIQSSPQRRSGSDENGKVTMPSSGGEALCGSALSWALASYRQERKKILYQEQSFTEPRDNCECRPRSPVHRPPVNASFLLASAHTLRQQTARARKAVTDSFEGVRVAGLNLARGFARA